MQFQHQFPTQAGVNHSTRSTPIPRPWLKDNNAKGTQDDLEILGEHRWEFSISKLSSCCFGKPSGESSKPPLHAPFGLIRRSSSGSHASYELDSVRMTTSELTNNGFESSLMLKLCFSLQSDGSDSVSEFTDSDATSASVPMQPSGTIHRRQQTLEATPQSAAARPPVLGPRSRSAGLPPLNRNSSVGTPMNATSRNRSDTGEYTRGSNSSNTSRHRRMEQFEFSPHSISSIWSHEPYNPRPTTTPPVEVHFPDGYDNYMQFNNSFQSSFDDISGFEGWSVGHEPNGSSNNDSDARAASDDNQKNQAARPPRPNRSRRSKGRKKKLKPEMSMPMYLRKQALLDDKVTGNLILSGWVGASLYDDALESRLKEAASKMSIQDIFYMQIMKGTTSASVDLYDPSGVMVHQLVLKKDWDCSSREVSSRIGKMVFIESPIFTILRLLPISLEDAFFNGESLVSPKEFSQVQSMLFASGPGKVYAPDEQHDAATFILFTLDALIKQFGL